MEPALGATLHAFTEHPTVCCIRASEHREHLQLSRQARCPNADSGALSRPPGLRPSSGGGGAERGKEPPQQCPSRSQPRSSYLLGGGHPAFAPALARWAAWPRTGLLQRRWALDPARGLHPDTALQAHCWARLDLCRASVSSSVTCGCCGHPVVSWESQQKARASEWLRLRRS